MPLLLISSSKSMVDKNQLHNSLSSAPYLSHIFSIYVCLLFSLLCFSLSQCILFCQNVCHQLRLQQDAWSSLISLFYLLCLVTLEKEMPKSTTTKSATYLSVWSQSPLYLESTNSRPTCSWTINFWVAAVYLDSGYREICRTCIWVDLSSSIFISGNGLPSMKSNTMLTQTPSWIAMGEWHLTQNSSPLTLCLEEVPKRFSLNS